jgi:beta-glucosidase/6-phospho-beta-glucosidase/beta-galactosidase
MLRSARVAGLSCVILLAACKSSSSDSNASDAGPPPPAEVTFPSGFMWGSSTAAFQVEKGSANSDWAHWVAIPGKIQNGDTPDNGGPDSLAHVDDDVKLMTGSGQNAYRFSIEWSRIYPTRAEFDADTPSQAGIDAYTALLDKLKAANVKPLVTLVHFSLPDYLSDVTKPNDPQGWERPETSDLFVEWCKRITKRFGDRVDWWVTINEPLNAALGGYVQGSFPPGAGPLAVDRMLAVVKAEAIAHAKAFDAIHASDTVDADGDGNAAWVSVAAHQRTFHPNDPTEPDDLTATDRTRYIWNKWFLNAVVKGDWDDDLNGDLAGPKDKTGDPTLKGRVDYIGMNYYSDTLISAHRGIVIPVINAAPTFVGAPNDRPKTEFGWDIYSEGFGTVLDELKEYGKPVVVTENGIADSKDANRARFVAEHLYQMGWAIQRGIDVRGYFHWALVDNFEWASGFCPKFGFASVDPNTGARTARASLGTYKSIIAAAKVKTSDIDAMPAYVSAQTFCK